MRYPTDGPTPPVEYMLTTVDNPFDPFTQFDEWLSYDTVLGYNTPGYLAAIAHTSDELSDLDLSIAIQEAIDEIVEENVFGIHRKVKRGDITALFG
jgi:hypothetical protein